MQSHFLVALACVFPVAGLAAPPASFHAAVEADWLLQDKVRTGKRATARRAANVSTTQDAAGGVDGQITGKWGFHTLNEKNPWWHVDLGKRVAIDRVVLYNRCDNCGPRNNRILVLLSDDGKTWTKAYQHNNKPFWGHSDKKPLVVKLESERGRLLRIQLPGASYFHLDEVEIYGAADSKTKTAPEPAYRSSTSWKKGAAAR